MRLIYTDMKKLLTTLLLTLFLVGCVTPPKYDNNEYELLARLETSVVIISENCDDNERVKDMIPTLEYDARLLHTYSFYIPQNSEVYGIADILKEDVAQFKKQYDEDKATVAYCNIKSKLFIDKVRTALEVVARTPRD